MQINTALILCAGLGKRLNPLTLKTPKPLLEVNNITILEMCINLIIKFDEIYFNRMAFLIMMNLSKDTLKKFRLF